MGKKKNDTPCELWKITTKNGTDEYACDEVEHDAESGSLLLWAGEGEDQDLIAAFAKGHWLQIDRVFAEEEG